MKKFTLIELLVAIMLVGVMSVSKVIGANDRWYSQEQIMNAVFDPTTGSLIFKSTNTAPIVVNISRYDGKVSTGTAGIMSSTGTIFNALGEVLMVDYYIKGGSGADSQISNSKMGGLLYIPAGTAKSTPFFANPLPSPVINLESLTPGATLHYEVIYQKPE